MKKATTLIAYATACLSVLMGFVICLISLFLPPKGVVDSSALWLTGQAFLFAGAVFGIKGYIDQVVDSVKDQHK